MRNDKILSLLSLCMKAGRVKSGEFATGEAVKSGKAFLVLVAGDASNNTKKEFHNMCAYNRVPIYEYATKEELGSAIGREQRSSLAVCDGGFSKTLITYLDDSAKRKGDSEE